MPLFLHRLALPRSHFSRFGRTCRASVVLVALALLSATEPAVASNFYYGGGVYFAVNSNLGFYYSEASQFTIDSTRWERDNVYDPTDMSSSYASHDASDLTISDTASGNSYGYYQCQVVNSVAYERCTHGHIRIYANYNPDAQTRRATLCQEIGHGVGLQHDSGEGCTNGGRNSPYLGDHNRANINGRY